MTRKGGLDDMLKTLAAAVLSLVIATGTASAQSHPDFTGIWIAQAPDISVLLAPGEEISLTPFGAERYACTCLRHDSLLGKC